MPRSLTVDEIFAEDEALIAQEEAERRQKETENEETVATDESYPESETTQAPIIEGENQQNTWQLVHDAESNYAGIKCVISDITVFAVAIWGILIFTILTHLISQYRIIAN